MSIVHFYPFRFDLGSGTLWRRDALVPLSSRAARILGHLVINADAFVTQKDLLDVAWGDAHVEAATLKVYIREIRNALGDSALRPQYIETLRSRGYRFIALAEQRKAADAAAQSAVTRPGELAALQTALEQAQSGRRQVVLLAGRAGLGKTVLTQVFLTDPRFSDAWLAAAESIETSATAEPYYPVLEALTMLCQQDASALTHVARTAPTWLLELPALGRQTPAADSAAGGAPPSLERMMAEMQALIRALSDERLLVLVFEDLQWADDATLDLIAATAKRVEPMSLLVIGTLRSGRVLSSDRPAEALALELQRGGHAQVIMLTELGAEDVERYVRERFGSESIAVELAPLLHQFTLGHPARIVAALEGLIAIGSLRQDEGRWRLTASSARLRRSIRETLRALVARRFQSLPPPTRTLLRAAAHIGPRFSSHVAAVAADRDLASAEIDLEHLVSEGVLDHDSDTRFPDGTRSPQFRFRHALERDVIRTNTLSATAAELRRRITAARKWVP